MASNGNEANDSNFSSPMPAVGLDIAGATLVCLVLILSDIFIALRQRKPWIPWTLNCNLRLVFKFFQALEHIFDSFMFLLRLSADVINEFTIILIRVVGDCFTFAAEKASGIGFGFSRHRRGCDDEIFGDVKERA
ncbi:hypothetical protein Syun_031872 [Stephania yunnanensis]|uniref:Uncharacterized protein n=1 Tax=Stephania yunnanensis TaxID=152371 RepID=A0AAP0HF43_9MAGN